MAKIVERPQVQVSAWFELSEAEMAALDALASYGTDAFLKVFYEHMGKAYLRDHEQGLRTLFESVRERVPGIMSRARDARRAFAGHPSKGEEVDRG